MKRIKFAEGGQRKFLDLCILRLSSPSLRGLLQFGFDVKYSTLKNYYNCLRFIPEDFFKDLLEITGIDPSGLDFEYVKGNWGQVIGGKKSKRRV